MIGGVAVVVALIMGGVAVGAAMLSGGGTQPEEAMPKGAIAFAKVDLDPGAGQKIDAIRFLRKFPALKKHVTEDADLRKVLFEQVAQDAGWKDIDFAEDVEPWLGKRIAVAAYAPSQAQPDGAPMPDVLVALQVEDEGKAEEGLRRLVDTADSGSKPGFVVEDGYALLAQDVATAKRLAAKVSDGSLAEQKNFATDVGEAEDGVAMAWLDNGRLSEELGRLSPSMLGITGAGAGTSGRSTYVLRFDGPDVLELTGTVTDSDVLEDATPAVKGVETLPADSVVAFGLSNGDELLTRAFEAFRAQAKKDGTQGGQGLDIEDGIAQAESMLGIKLPDDLATLLGSNLVAALDASGLDGGEYQIGALVKTDGEAAMSILDKLEAAATQNATILPPLTRRTTDDGYVLATSEEQATRLMAADGKLGDDEAFQDAVPDLDGAGLVVWVNLKTLFAQLPFDDQGGENIQPLAGVGVTSVIEGGGDLSFRARLVTN